MSGPSPTRAELARAYRAAWYEVKTPDGNLRRFRVGMVRPELDALAGRRGWAWLSAFNPGSRRLSDAENHRRHQCLLDELAAAGWRVLDAASGDDAGHWPVEQAVCLLDIGARSARALAARHGQVAFVHARPGEGARLCWV